MTDQPPRPVFLERSVYQRRRMGDAAFFLSVFGALLLCAPVMWPGPAELEAEAVRGIAMSGAILYVFGVWVVLILLTALFGALVRRRDIEGVDSGNR